MARFIYKFRRSVGQEEEVPEEAYTGFGADDLPLQNLPSDSRQDTANSENFPLVTTPNQESLSEESNSTPGIAAHETQEEEGEGEDEEGEEEGEDEGEEEGEDEGEDGGEAHSLLDADEIVPVPPEGDNSVISNMGRTF